jgi:hypothetical protein
MSALTNPIDRSLKALARNYPAAFIRLALSTAENLAKTRQLILSEENKMWQADALSLGNETDLRSCFPRSSCLDIRGRSCKIKVGAHQ